MHQIYLIHLLQGAIVAGIKNCALPESKKRFIYLGDGRGDFCPSLKLEGQDHVLPRKGLVYCLNLLYKPSIYVALNPTRMFSGTHSTTLFLQTLISLKLKCIVGATPKMWKIALAICLVLEEARVSSFLENAST